MEKSLFPPFPLLTTLKMLTTSKAACFSYNVVNGGKGELLKFTDISNIGIKFSFLQLFKYILSKVVCDQNLTGVM